MLAGLFVFSPPVFAQTVDVSIVDFSFNPQSIEIDVGTTVRWTNNDAVPHTTTSNTGVWDSGNMASGETFSFTFKNTGTFGYFCEIHPSMTGTIEVVMPTPAGDDFSSSLPEKFRVHPNYPNPFNPATNIAYELPKQTKVEVEVYNILGHKVATLQDGIQPAGVYTITWDSRDKKGEDVSSGIYFYLVTTEDGNRAGKMMLVK